MDLCYWQHCSQNKTLQNGINKYFDIAEADFKIYGQIQNEWEPYIKGKDYQAFVIQRKKT